MLCAKLKLGDQEIDSVCFQNKNQFLIGDKSYMREEIDALGFRIRHYYPATCEHVLSTDFEGSENFWKTFKKALALVASAEVGTEAITTAQTVTRRGRPPKDASVETCDDAKTVIR